MDTISAKSISVITLEDHYLTREGIRSLLSNSPDIELVGEGSAGEHLEPLVVEKQPDIVLLDLNLPQKENGSVRMPGNSFRVIPSITWMTETYPNTKVIIVSQYISPAIAEGVLDAGVRGYLLKDDTLTRYLPETIRAVYNGGHYFSDEVSSQLRDAQPELLTRRQHQVIRAIASEPDLPLAVHAEHLGISVHTLSNHRRQIFERLGARSMAGAIIKAIKLGIVSVAFIDPLQQDVASDNGYL